MAQDGMGGGWVLNQHVWDGQGLKDPCFFELFLEEQSHKEKLILYGRNWITCKDNFQKENSVFFKFFDT
jgi:hypothetical protein